MDHDLCEIDPVPRLDWFGNHAAVSRVCMYGEQIIHLHNLSLRYEGEQQSRSERYACRRAKSVDADVLKDI